MKNKDKKALKIMFIDIETSPNIGYFWRPGNKISIDHNCILEERSIICISYKWAGESKVYNLTWDPKSCIQWEGESKAYSLTWDPGRSDKKLLQEFCKVAQSARMIVAHNGDRFDIPWLKGRLLAHGLEPLINLTSIDTLKLSRNNFNLNSHKLDYLAKFLGVGGKISTGWSLWKDVISGCKSSLKKMVVYCNNDVKILEKVFFKMLPYVKKLPIDMRFLLSNKKDGCTNCASKDVIKWGYYVSAANRKQRYRCNSCSHYYLGENIKTTEVDLWLC